MKHRGIGFDNDLFLVGVFVNVCTSVSCPLQEDHLDRGWPELQRCTKRPLLRIGWRGWGGQRGWEKRFLTWRNVCWNGGGEPIGADVEWHPERIPPPFLIRSSTFRIQFFPFALIENETVAVHLKKFEFKCQIFGLFLKCYLQLSEDIFLESFNFRCHLNNQNQTTALIEAILFDTCAKLFQSLNFWCLFLFYCRSNGTPLPIFSEKHQASHSRTLAFRFLWMDATPTGSEKRKLLFPSQIFGSDRVEAVLWQIGLLKIFPCHILWRVSCDHIYISHS